MMARYDKTTISLVIALVVLLVGNFLVADWVRFIALQSLSRGLVALGLMVMWRAGLISFGHALYFGVGAYATAYLSHFEGITDAFVLLFASMVAGGGLAYVLGFLLRRYRDIFFALLNMAFSMILYGILVKTPTPWAAATASACRRRPSSATRPRARPRILRCSPSPRSCAASSESPCTAIFPRPWAP